MTLPFPGKYGFWDTGTACSGSRWWISSSWGKTVMVNTWKAVTGSDGAGTELTGTFSAFLNPLTGLMRFLLLHLKLFLQLNTFQALFLLTKGRRRKYKSSCCLGAGLASP